MRQDPYDTWTYREIECRLYKYPKPDGHRWVAYVKIGDEWEEVVDNDSIDEEKVRKKVETKVDRMIRKALSDDNRNTGTGTPIDKWEPSVPDIDVPNPEPWPNPRDPHEPNVIWDADPQGKCGACEKLRKGTTWIGEPPKCQRHQNNTVPAPEMGETTVATTGTVQVQTTDGTMETMSMSSIMDEEPDFENGKIVV